MSVSFKTHYKSPIGLIEITGTADSLTSLYFVDDNSYSSSTNESNQFLEQCIKQLAEYFAGDRKEFELKLMPEGTEFQKKVWNELLKIPFGETKSYLWQSKMLGNQLAIRA
ncbi:MAG: methylated-DNA--[protein]-cysteine S-methyltransferase, partial [Melioribacteraceae bacterium]